MDNLKFNNLSNYFNFTPICNLFIEKYISKANPIFVVIYIFLLNKCFKNESLIINEISKEFDILESDILKCLNYWKEHNLIEYKIENENLYVNFLNIKIETAPKVIIQKEKSYSDEEIMFYSKQEEVQQLFRLAENKLAKTLSYQDRKKIIELYEGYNISIEVFATLLTYCKERNKTNFNYIEKVALDWCENGIDTAEKVDEYIKIYDENYKKILKALGINSEPTKAQLVYLKKWTNEYKMSLKLIEKACDITLITIGRASFEYVDKILISWKAQNIATIEQVEEINEKFKAEKQIKFEENQKKLQKNLENKQYSQNYKNDKFVNYTQPKLDFKKLREYEIKNLRGEI